MVLMVYENLVDNNGPQGIISFQQGHWHSEARSDQGETS